jgi:hypothetical protein
MNKIQQKLTDADRKRARCLDPDWVYTPAAAAATDIRKTWLKFGWKPIREQYILKDDAQ